MSEQRQRTTDAHLLLHDQVQPEKSLNPGANPSGSDEGPKTDAIVRSQKLYPTEEAYSDLLAAFTYFNDKLFGGRLSTPLITLARKPGMLGAFCPNRFQNRSGDLAHEIILNPYYLKQRSDIETLSTLVHEMAHQWREECGPQNSKAQKPCGRYHDAVWADRMEEIGLMPSDTGKAGGSRTGARVAHYVIEDGPFEVTANLLIKSGYVIRWGDRLTAEEKGTGVLPAASNAPAQPAKPKDRIKFTCPTCSLNAWAKPSAELKCVPCDARLHANKP